ncbi:hypothetical protein B0H14DRAFT_3137462 [Mycena olivaceomarginata]|nr:hypothetical protein B0H14DRAFT_3137462 [Mycena olivaceomarginata]
MKKGWLYISSHYVSSPCSKPSKGRPLRPHDSERTNPTARLAKERLIRVPVCPPVAHQMSICQCKVDAKGSIAPGSPASPAEVDNMHLSGRVDVGRIGRSVFECPSLLSTGSGVFSEFQLTLMTARFDGLESIIGRVPGPFGYPPPHSDHGFGYKTVDPDPNPENPNPNPRV